jgi:hypothetical protein
MKTKKSTLYIGNYFDGESDNYLIFVADENCDRERELKKAHLGEYGDKLDDADINGVYKISEAYDYHTRDTYDIELTKVK